MPLSLASWISGEGVCFRQQECFERDQPLLCLCQGNGQEMCSALLEDESEWNAHED